MINKFVKYQKNSLLNISLLDEIDNSEKVSRNSIDEYSKELLRSTPNLSPLDGIGKFLKNSVDELSKISSNLSRNLSSPYRFDEIRKIYLLALLQYINPHREYVINSAGLQYTNSHGKNTVNRIGKENKNIEEYIGNRYIIKFVAIISIYVYRVNGVFKLTNLQKYYCSNSIKGQIAELLQIPCSFDQLIGVLDEELAEIVINFIYMRINIDVEVSVPFDKRVKEICDSLRSTTGNTGKKKIRIK